jgi:glutaredoxin
MAKVVKFTQNPCPKCNMLNDMLKATGLSADEEILITDANRDEIKEKHNIMSTPTLVAFDDNGNEISRVASVGFGTVKSFFDSVK